MRYVGGVCMRTTTDTSYQVSHRRGVRTKYTAQQQTVQLLVPDFTRPGNIGKIYIVLPVRRLCTRVDTRETMKLYALPGMT